jgi:hypothetical protein
MYDHEINDFNKVVVTYGKGQTADERIITKIKELKAN